MSTGRSHRILMAGLPAVGKTTFLAALWYFVQQTNFPSRLRFKRLERDSQYLNQIKDTWLECNPVARTPVGTEKIVNMILTKEATGEDLTLFFPDLSGESFSHQWIDREYSTAYGDFLKGACGGVVFIHPDQMKKPIRIDTAMSVAGGIPTTAENQAPAATEPPAPVKDWSPIETPTQVQNIELLQFIMASDRPHGPFRLAVIVSAWDRVAALKKSPAEWLSSQFPMLDQFLRSNDDEFETNVYGVSAQGGDYEKEGSKLGKLRPGERVQIVGPDIQKEHDITEPLAWLIQ